jgi:hypothetical protein
LDDPQCCGRHSALDRASASKFSSGSKIKQKNLIQSHGPTFSNTAKLNILVLFPECGSILLFCDTEKF